VRDKMDRSYEDYLNIYRKDIASICVLACKNHSDSKMEYEDLYQEATIKLFDIFQKGKAVFKSYTLKSIKNHVRDLFRKDRQDLLSRAKSIGLIVSIL
jgi:DNA-directed RNA polymerase specialized sigma24 family protein